MQILSDTELERFIEEDVPYGDLTTHLLAIGHQNGTISFTTREESVLCGTEEAGRVLEKCGCRVSLLLPSGCRCAPGTVFLTAHGPATALHAGWKVALNLLEYASGIASVTGRIVAAVRAVNPDIAVLTTRKSFPGTKKIAVKAIMAGGALPHRLGLSETILVFKQHTVFTGGLQTFLERLPILRLHAPETKIIVEADTPDEAVLIAMAGADVVQVDKLAPADLKTLVATIRGINPAIKVSAAGGIHEANAATYAATGIDIIVLSSVYFSKPADIAVTIKPD